MRIEKLETKNYCFDDVRFFVCLLLFLAQTSKSILINCGIEIVLTKENNIDYFLSQIYI